MPIILGCHGNGNDDATGHKIISIWSQSFTLWLGDCDFLPKFLHDTILVVLFLLSLTSKKNNRRQNVNGGPTWVVAILQWTLRPALVSSVKDDRKSNCHRLRETPRVTTTRGRREWKTDVRSRSLTTNFNQLLQLRIFSYPRFPF